MKRIAQKILKNLWKLKSRGRRSLALGTLILLWIPVASGMDKNVGPRVVALNIKSLHKEAQATLEHTRSLILESKREEAINILKQKILEGELSSAVKQAFINEIQTYGELFLSDRGQQLFESAESIRFSGRNDFSKVYAEALKAEPHNFLVLEALVQTALQAGECSTAENFLQTLTNLSPSFALSSYYSVRINVCRGETDPADYGKDLVLFKQAELKHWWQVLTLIEVDHLLKPEESLRQRLNALDKGIGRGQNAVDYFIWQTDRDLAAVEEFITGCKGETIDSRKLTKFYPNRCGELPNIEEEVVKEKERIKKNTLLEKKNHESKNE